MELKTVPLSEININDKTFFWSFPEINQELEDSLQKHGILEPAALLQKDGDYSILDGYKRINFCRKKGIKEIPAKVFNKKEHSPAGLLELTVVLNSNARGINLIEKSIIIKKAVSDFNLTEDNILKQTFPLLDVSPTRYYYNFYIKTAALPQRIKHPAVKLDFTEANLKSLLDWDNKSLLNISSLIEETSVRGNKLRRMLDLFREIYLRDGITAAEILNKVEFEDIRQHKDWISSQKYEHISARLFRLRYPMFSAEQEKLKSLLASVNVSKQYKLELPENLESAYIKLISRLKSSKDFIKTGKEMQKLGEDKIVKEIFKLL